MVDTGYFNRIMGTGQFDRIMYTGRFDIKVDTEQFTLTSSAMIEVRIESILMFGSKVWRIKYVMFIVK